MTTTLPDNAFRGNLLSDAANLPQHWQAALQRCDVQAALEQLDAFLSQRLTEGAVIFPTHPFKALHGLPPEAVRVIILGQDPYHGPGQAQGLAFSVPDHCPCPPSLRNIFSEIAREFPDQLTVQSNNLERWVKQGVLLLNTVLTVESGQPASHSRRGWETVTDALIEHVACAPQPKVFMLWGNHAQQKQPLIPANNNTLVLRSNHPSPLSARRPPVPFLGCNHFADANCWLRNHGAAAIDWS
ncbi:MAG: uracil-DNA glycosylase [Pusillimonas sp.]